MASLYLTVGEARITCAIVDAAAQVRDSHPRFGPDGITICDPNGAGEGADKVFQRIYERAI